MVVSQDSGKQRKKRSSFSCHVFFKHFPKLGNAWRFLNVSLHAVKQIYVLWSVQHPTVGHRVTVVIHDPDQITVPVNLEIKPKWLNRVRDLNKAVPQQVWVIVGASFSSFRFVVGVTQFVTERYRVFWIWFGLVKRYMAQMVSNYYIDTIGLFSSFKMHINCNCNCKA